MVEREQSISGSGVRIEPIPPVGRGPDIPVPGILPPQRDKDGNIIPETDPLRDEGILSKLTPRLNGNAWFHELKKRVESGEKNAIFVIGAGVVSFFVATAGVEFGLRHSRDIKELFNVLDKVQKKARGKNKGR